MNNTNEAIEVPDYVPQDDNLTPEAKLALERQARECNDKAKAQEIEWQLSLEKPSWVLRRADVKTPQEKITIWVIKDGEMYMCFEGALVIHIEDARPFVCQQDAEFVLEKRKSMGLMSKFLAPVVQKVEVRRWTTTRYDEQKY